MAHEANLAALHAIGLAVGAALCALLGLMQWRVDRATGRASGYQLLWVVGFIWTFGSFLRYSLLLAGAGGEAISVRAAEALSWSSTILGPVAIGRFLQARIGATHAARAFVVFTGFVSLLNLAIFAWAWMTRGFDLGARWYSQVSFYVALCVTAVALILYRIDSRRDGSDKIPKPRWFVRGVLLLAIIQIAATLLSLQSTWLPAGLISAMSLISEHWVIPWSILIAVSLAQIHAADLVLKRSLWLLASVTIAVLASRFVFRVSPGLPMVVSTLACATLILGAPWLIRALTWLVDRVMLKRADYAVAARQLDESIRAIHDPRQLFEVAACAVRSAMHVDAHFVPADGGAAPSPPLLASIPIETTGAPRYRLEVSASHHARTLMSQEFEFLNTIGIQVSRRLDFLHFEAEQRALHLREERLRRLLTEAELKALRTQVDPHFLFNTLNTIADLIGSDPDTAEKMTVRLAECFRYALSRHARDLSTLDDELEFARHYLDIEQVRFGDRLRVHLSRGDASGRELVPSLLLQPLLENAIRHGLAPVREGGSISVTARRAGENLELQVDDDGLGLKPEFGERLGVGLQNVKERLAALYSQAATFSIRRRDDRGTSVTIQVPAHEN